MKRLAVFLSLFITGLLFVSSQTVITGSVRNKKKEAMPFVSVTMQALNDSTILGFAYTDEGGHYRLMSSNGANDSLVITVRGMVIGTACRTVPNRSATIDFIVEERANQLREIRISAISVRRSNDTLNYAVGAFAAQSDRTIEDVLKKMPGIEVSSSGAISYNGKSISKFYIEGLDMLGGRYNVATRNIEAKDVASVQVYENHQPVKVENVFSDQAAINLRLKESVKGVWAVQALAGLGYKPWLYDAALTAMQFARNRQHLSTYKGNNNGHTAEEELLKHYDSGAALPLMRSMLAVSQPATPDVERSRYIDNRTNSVSANQLMKIRDTELTANVNFYNERIGKDGYTSFTQYLPGATKPLVIEETTSSTSRENNLDMTLGVQANKEMEYIHNRLNVKSSWDGTRTCLVAKDGNRQSLDNPYFSISNDLSVMKRWGNHLFRIRFDVSYNDRPHKLRISPAGYFNQDSLQMLNQEVTQKDITASLRTSYGLTAGCFTLNYAPRFSMELRKLTSSLGMTDRHGSLIPASDSMRNDLWYNNYQIGLDQDYTCRLGNTLRMRLFIPTYLSILANDDCLNAHSVSHQRWIVNPSFTADYSFSPSFTAVANGYYRTSYGSMNDAYKGYILQSYRNLLRNTDDRLFENRSCGARLGLEYRDVVRMLFLNVGGGIQHSGKNLLYGYSYDGIVGMKTTIDQPTGADTYNLFAASSKSWDFWQTKIDLSVGMDRGKSELLLQGDILPFHTRNYSAGASCSAAPCQYFNVAYRFAWMKSEQWTMAEDNKALPDMIAHSHNGKVWIFPTGKLSVHFNIDYQYINEASDPDIIFADALIRYAGKATDWEMECDNLFNARRYVSTVHSGMSTSVSSCPLRPLSVLLKVRFKLK